MADAAEKLPDTATPSNPAPTSHAPPRARQAPPPKPDAKAEDAGRAWPDKETMADPGRLAKPLPQNRWQLKEFRDPGHHVVLERGTPYEAVFDPSFWANVAMVARFEPGQRIELVNDELTVFADLIILDCGRNWATVAEYQKRTLDELVKSRPPMKQQQQHRTEFNGPIDKWRIVRADAQVIKAGFPTQADAEKYLADHLRRLGA